MEPSLNEKQGRREHVPAIGVLSVSRICRAQRYGFEGRFGKKSRSRL
ncbi:predicted protein [Botrytis cinerea T4]|uniref:Uncharacterized protein n=1 Tax=Botryotinia fuckeliana (strain T4) TaxID=999810 RepID=G2Y4G2_BOTF4|nr:predicted protein [Botrytis cinerea T4]